MPLPKLPSYREKNSLRPNPSTAARPGRVVRGKDERLVMEPDASLSDLAFVQGPVLQGDFGDDGASARRVNGLPPETPPKPGGKPDETRAGWP